VIISKDYLNVIQSCLLQTLPEKANAYFTNFKSNPQFSAMTPVHILDTHWRTCSL